MKIEIEYCVPCGYQSRATDAQTRLLEEFGGRIESVATVNSLIPAADGVQVDGRELLMGKKH